MQVDKVSGKVETYIGFSAFGSTKLSKGAVKLARLSKSLTNAQMAKNERLEKKVGSRISHYCSSFQLSLAVNHKAKAYYAIFLKSKPSHILTSEKRDCFAVAIICFTCKLQKIPFTIHEMSLKSQLDESMIRSQYKLIMQNSSLKEKLAAMISQSSHEDDKPTLQNSIPDITKKFMTQMRYPETGNNRRITEDASFLAQKFINLMEGKRPSTISAASILAAFELNGVSEFDDLLEELEQISGVKSKTILSTKNDILERALTDKDLKDFIDDKANFLLSPEKTKTTFRTQRKK